MAAITIECLACGFGNPAEHKLCVKCNKPLPHKTTYHKWIEKGLSLFYPEKKIEEVSECKVEKGSVFRTEKNDKYTVVQKIGNGSYGDVFLVEQENKNKTTNRKYAIKMLRLWAIAPRERKNVASRFRQEYELAKMAKDIGSSFLVHALGQGYMNGNPFFVMDYCAGGSLRENIQNSYSETEIRAIATEILNGLCALHSQGIVHRDLKPENILFDNAPPPNGQVKLVDFGIAGNLKSRMTKTNFDGSIDFTMGTDAYIPPEQFDRAKAFKVLGNVTDMFAFGIVLFELLSNGQFPYGIPPEYDEKNQEKYNIELEAYCQKVRKNEWIVLDNLRDGVISKTWADIIERCIDADSSKRTNNAETILNELNRDKTSTKFKTNKAAFWTGNKYVLRVMNGWQPNLAFNLSDMMTDKGYLTIGRYDEDEPDFNAISITELNQPCYISRTQATIEVGLKTGIWYLRDGQYRKMGANYQWIDSRNGTFLNDNLVSTKGIAIKAGDIITMGDTTFRVEKE
jgi:serine/threonine protein kinase